MFKTLTLTLLLLFSVSMAGAAELAGVFVDDAIKTESGQSLVLNGAGLREKFWVDVYVGSLYLENKTSDVAGILSSPGPWRIQLDFIYKEVDRQKLLDSWREGFENNQEFLQIIQHQSKAEPKYENFFAS